MRELFSQIPKNFKIVFSTIFIGVLLAFFVVEVAVLIHERLASTAPVTQNDIEAAKRKLELERISQETINLPLARLENKTLEERKAQAVIEAHRISLNLSPEQPEHGISNLERLGDLLSKHIVAIIAVIAASYILPSFANTRDPWRLGFTISAVITLAGVLALWINATSNSKLEGKLNVFSFTVSSSSVAVLLTAIGAVLCGVCLYAIRHESGSTNNKTDA